MTPQLFKHINNTDVAFEIVKRYFIREKMAFKLKVKWWNIGVCHAPWCMSEKTQKIIIPVDKWKEWEEYEYEEKKDDTTIDT